jgi:tape measure domain-containing protein
MTAERVGALRYDVILNASSLKKGAMDSRSALKTFRDAMRGATTDVDRYQAGIKNLQKLRADGSITQEQGLTILKELNKDLDKAGFKKVAHNKFEKTNIKLKEEELALQKKINREADLEKKIEAEKNKFQEDAFVKRRNRSKEEHQKVLQRAHEIKKANKNIFQQRVMDAKRFSGKFGGMVGGMSPGMQAGVFGNIAGAMGASGPMIGAVRGAAMLGAKMVPIVAGFAGLALALKKATENAMQLRKTTIDLSVLMGNSDEAAAGLIRRFQKLARETPLTTTQLAEGARQLMSFGRESKFVVEDLKALGTIAGGDVERLRLLTKAFADVTAAGKLQGQELRQFTNQGFNPLRKMVEMTGESYDSLRKKMEDGAISAEMVSKALAASAEQYSERLTKAMDTIGGQWSKLKGILFELSTTPGAPIERLGATMLEWVNMSLEGYEMGFDRLGQIGDRMGNNFVQKIQDLKNILTFDFGQLGQENRFGKPMTFKEMNEHREKQRKEIEKSQEKAAKINGRTTAANKKAMDDVAKQTSEQKKIIQELEDQFNRVSQFERMRREVSKERMRMRMTKEDFEKAIMQIDELEKMHEEAEKKRRMVEDPQKDLDKMHEHRMKLIDEEGNERKKQIEDRFKKEKDAADALKKMGGPSVDFTSAGADYRFVQQRVAENLAFKAQDAANKKREMQLDTLNQQLEEMRREAKLNTEEVRRSLPQAVN